MDLIYVYYTDGTVEKIHCWHDESPEIQYHLLESSRGSEIISIMETEDH